MRNEKDQKYLDNLTQEEKHTRTSINSFTRRDNAPMVFLEENIYVTKNEFPHSDR